ncbi:uncharacterized protein GGS25DRAFT_494043 [Hypoxylon fragiforme]|uniref:uncharacterized protein n=1 Tax=Hypoxylon fragiforme TaxID=63214 RepID=UPI0020C60F1B|nr:uncharacterized protein GGS25DRAFT_494043 [Hypoxylon fragiforme]KAI2607006.1 hypothetical protein GGS25DRAFT_494043 [Hypoxylon fragiforme]
MANLLNLPNEILLLILETLALIDLQALLTAQRTNRRLHILVQDAIHNVQNTAMIGYSPAETAYYTTEIDPSPLQINPLWRSKFKGLFHTADCFTAADKRRLAFLTLHGDYTLPFRRLPWAHSEATRAAFLRPEASWRNLSVTFGQRPITHLDVIKSYSAPGGDSVEYYQLDLAPSGLTMGLFYEVLLCDEATYGEETGSWELLVGQRLRSYDVLAEYECYIPGDRELIDAGEGARQAAVLYVRGGPVTHNYTVGVEETSWIVKNQAKQKLLPWQGPIQNFIFTGYYEY